MPCSRSKGRKIADPKPRTDLERLGNWEQKQTSHEKIFFVVFGVLHQLNYSLATNSAGTDFQLQVRVSISCNHENEHPENRSEVGLHSRI